jgi:predicted amidophosphoribosyltransferase
MILIVTQLIEDFLSLFFPDRCLICGVEEKIPVCSSCLSDFVFIDFPICRLCGMPVDVTNDDDRMKCEPCRTEPPLYTLCRSVFKYEGNVKESILQMKMEGRTELAPILAEFIDKYFSENENLFDIDIIVPVPRGGAKTKITVGSASLLCTHLKIGEEIPIVEALKRTRKTKAQSSLNFKERWKNVADAFAVQDSALINEKKVLLIDDIFLSNSSCSCVVSFFSENFFEKKFSEPFKKLYIG